MASVNQIHYHYHVIKTVHCVSQS